MIDLDNYYLHGTGSWKGRDVEEYRIIRILRDGVLKTRNQLNGWHPRLCNNDNEICLVDPTVKLQDDDFEYYDSALKDFVLNAPALAFSRDIDVYKPKLVDKYDSRTRGMKWTDMKDEVRYIGNLSLKHLEFITVPFSLSTSPEKDYFCFPCELDTLLSIVSIIEKEFPNVEIKDIFTGCEVTSSKIEDKMLIKDYK